jgi:hypothetical protein
LESEARSHGLMLCLVIRPLKSETQMQNDEAGTARVISTGPCPALGFSRVTSRRSRPRLPEPQPEHRRC